MELSIALPQFPTYKATIHSFGSITNAKQIRKSLLSGDPKYDFAFIDPQTIISLEVLYAAIYRALLDNEAEKLRTRSLHSEVVFGIGAGSKIGEILGKFGIKDDSTDLIVLKITDGDLPYDLGEIINGVEEIVSEEVINEKADVDCVKKAYKLEGSRDELVRLIVGAISLRGH